MASLSLFPQLETNLMSNRKVIEFLLQLKRAKAHGKNYIKVRPPHSAIFSVIVYFSCKIVLQRWKEKKVQVEDVMLHIAIFSCNLQWF